jgi:arginine metabolism regulation protein II
MESLATGITGHIPFDIPKSSVYSTLVLSNPSLPVPTRPGRRRHMARGKATRSGTSSHDEVRSRTFTGCRTCRSRHLKCDEARPVCSSCRRLKLPCEGYAARLLWVSEQGPSLTEKQAHRGSSYRYLLFTETDRSTMSSELIGSLGTQSAGDVLQDLDAEVVQAGQSHSVGPFGVFRAFGDFSAQEAASPEDDPGWFTQLAAAKVDGLDDSGLAEDNANDILPTRSWLDNTTLDAGIFSDSYVEVPSSSTISILDQPWKDLESICDSFQMISCDTPSLNFLFSPPRSPCQLDSINETHDNPAKKKRKSRPKSPSRAEFTTEVSDLSEFLPRMSSHVPGGGDRMLPPHAVPLLRYYKEHALDSSIFSQGMKVSPWKLFALPCALETFAELSLWNNTSHTRFSILYTIMAKSAFHLNRSNKGDKQASDISLQLAFGYQKAAQEHLESALREEVGQIMVDGGCTSENADSSMSRCKYVEVLTAVLSLSVISVSHSGIINRESK